MNSGNDRSDFTRAASADSVVSSSVGLRASGTEPIETIKGRVPPKTLLGASSLAAFATVGMVVSAHVSLVLMERIHESSVSDLFFAIVAGNVSAFADADISGASAHLALDIVNSFLFFGFFQQLVLASFRFFPEKKKPERA